jgi:hypothetical protein
MIEKQRPWRLPDGVKFYIYPKYAMAVEGVRVTLTPTQARIVLLLMANPGRRFSSHEIMSVIFDDREDGGAGEKSYIPVHMLCIKDRCLKAGIELRLKVPGAYQGYAFMGVSLTDRAGVETARPVDPPKSTKEKMGGHPYIDVFDGTGGWTFPLRIQIDQWRRMKVSVK